MEWCGATLRRRRRRTVADSGRCPGLVGVLRDRLAELGDAGNGALSSAWRSGGSWPFSRSRRPVRREPVRLNPNELLGTPGFACLRDWAREPRLSGELGVPPHQTSLLLEELGQTRQRSDMCFDGFALIARHGMDIEGLTAEVL